MDTDSEDDNIPISELIRRDKEKMKSAEKKSSKTKSSSSSSSSSKKSEPSSKKQKTTNNSSNKSNNDKSKSKPKPKSTTAASTSTNKPKKSSTNDLINEINEFYNDTDKGQLVQKLMVRWWYAIDWPDLSKCSTAPAGGYEPLEGFPGVFVGTSDENLGNIKDLRESSNRPNLCNLSRKTSEELQKLCVTAYEEQIKQLLESEGSDTKLERELRSELRWAKSVKVDKADKKAASYTFNQK